MYFRRLYYKVPPDSAAAREALFAAEILPLQRRHGAAL